MGHDTIKEIMADKSEAETSDVTTTPTPTDGLDTSGDAVQLEVDSAPTNLDPENPDGSAGEKEDGKPEVKDGEKPPEEPEKKPEEGEKTEDGKKTAEGEKPKKSKIHRKIDRLTREKHVAEEKADKLSRENETLRAAQADKGPDKLPVEDDFDDYDQYTDALGTYKANQQLEKQRTKEAGDAATDAQQAAGRQLEAQLDGGRDKYDDFDAVALKMPKDGGPVVTETMLAAMQDSENMADIAYHLGNNVEEAARIAALSPIAQIKAIAHIETGFTANSESSSKSSSDATAPEEKISGAPDPIDTVGSTGKTKRDPDKMSQSEFETAFEAGKL